MRPANPDCIPRYARQERVKAAFALVGSILCLGYLVLAFMAHLMRPAEDWVCTRAGYKPVKLLTHPPKLIPATPCTEWTNVRTGQVLLIEQKEDSL